jgi:hypothetical protein
MKNNPEEIALAIEKINALQEKGTREIDIARLENITKDIEHLYESVPSESKAAVANSLGLAYRRLGERGNRDVLRQAIVSFENGLKFTAQNSEPDQHAQDTLFVELRNNIAITYIRMFELEKDEEYLNKAEARLNECVRYIDESQTLKESQDNALKSNVYNNVGNLWKQRYASSQDPLSAKKALENYTIAENFSPEKSAPYFWATIQKNKGEIKYLLSREDKDDTRIREGIVHCLDSLRYRDRVSAPYQWLKSIAVLFDLALLSPQILAEEPEYRGKITSVVEGFLLIEESLEHKNYKPLKEKYQQMKTALANL